MKMSNASGAVCGSAVADGLRDPAPVRVAAVQRGLDQRRVGDRAGDALDDTVSAAAHDDAADPLGALAVAHDVQRELAQRPVERLAEAHLVRRSAARRARRTRPTPAGSPCRWWRAARPRETRSNERCDAHAEQQVGGLGAQRRVGLDEAEHRRERGRDHPRALGLRGQPDGAGRQRDVDLDLLGELVRGADRLGEVAVAVLAQLAARAGDAA